MRTFLMTILCLAFASCSTDINPVEDEMDYAEYNQKVITYLQRKYNVEAEVEFSPNYKQKLSKAELDSYENFYKFIGSLKEKPMEMTQSKQKATRASFAGTYFFEKYVNYELDGVKVCIYYDADMDGALYGSNPTIEMGLGGEGVSKNYSNAYYSLDTYRHDYRVSGKKIIADAIRGDYVVTFYTDFIKEYRYVDGEWKIVPSGQSVISSRQRIKLVVAGELDTANGSSNFTLYNAGKGSWFGLDLGDGEM